jgi:hypothetical protein
MSNCRIEFLVYAIPTLPIRSVIIMPETKRNLEKKIHDQRIKLLNFYRGFKELSSPTNEAKDLIKFINEPNTKEIIDGILQMGLGECPYKIFPLGSPTNNALRERVTRIYKLKQATLWIACAKEELGCTNDKAIYLAAPFFGLREEALRKHYHASSTDRSSTSTLYPY